QHVALAMVEVGQTRPVCKRGSELSREARNYADGIVECLARFLRLAVGRQQLAQLVVGIDEQAVEMRFVGKIDDKLFEILDGLAEAFSGLHGLLHLLEVKGPPAESVPELFSVAEVPGNLSRELLEEVQLPLPRPGRLCGLGEPIEQHPSQL